MPGNIAMPAPASAGVANQARRREERRVDRRTGGQDRADDRRPTADSTERGAPDLGERDLPVGEDRVLADQHLRADGDRDVDRRDTLKMPPPIIRRRPS
jgi:hypothetical protein